MLLVPLGYSGKKMADLFCLGFADAIFKVVFIITQRGDGECGIKRPKARAEMARESTPLNNGRNRTEEFDGADAGKQMKGKSAVH